METLDTFLCFVLCEAIYISGAATLARLLFKVVDIIENPKRRHNHVSACERSHF